MFDRLFGASDEEKMEYLEVRVVTSLVLIAASLVLSIFFEESLAIIALIGYYWGWSAIKRWFGVAGFLTWILGMRNVVLGVIFGLAFLIIGYIGGLLMFVSAVICYISLKRSKS